MENLRDILEKLDTYKDVGLNKPPAPPSNDGNDSDALEEASGNNYCSICSGKGWVTPKVETGHPDFGSIMSCECRKIFTKDETSKKLLAHSNLGYLSRHSFETLTENVSSRNDVDSQQFASALNLASNYAISPKGWLTIAGPHGSGKTYLAAAIANRCINSGIPVFFIYVSDLFDTIRTSRSRSEDQESDELLNQIKNVPLLVLDGLNAVNQTTWPQEKLTQILNYRFNAELPTVLTTTELIRNLDPFISSRMENSQFSSVIMTGKAAPNDYFSGSFGKIPTRLKSKTLENFSVTGTRNRPYDQLVKALEAAQDYAENPDGWLVLEGPTGVGKTHLAVAIANEFEKRKEEFIFTASLELMDFIRTILNSSSYDRPEKIYDQILNIPLLILDDMGSESSTMWVQEKLNQLISYRQDWGLPTIVTTQQEFEKMASEGSKIASRIQDKDITNLIKVYVDDYRLARQKT